MTSGTLRQGMPPLTIRQAWRGRPVPRSGRTVGRLPANHHSSGLRMAAPRRSVTTTYATPEVTPNLYIDLFTAAGTARPGQAAPVGQDSCNFAGNITG